MNGKKIMFVIPSLEGGGAERVAANLLKGFSEAGIECIVVLFNKKDGYGLPGSVRVRHLGIGEYKNIICAAVKFFLVIFRLAKIIREERPFNILSFMDYTNIVAILGNIVAGKKAKTTASVHISPTLYLGRYAVNVRNRFISVMMRLCYRLADTLVAVSFFIRDDLIRNYGIEETKVVAIYNPLDIGKIEMLGKEETSHPWFRDNIPVIISAGRLTKQKGFDCLLKAFAIVRGRIPARLIILGEGEEDKNLRELSRMLGIDRDVDFAGFQKNPYNFMKHSAIYVLPSLYEGFPVVLIEAMTCGIPVVSTVYNPGMNEIVEHEKNGLLVPVQDEKSLAEAIQRLLADPEEGKRLVHEAKKKVRELSLENIVMQYKKVLLGVAE